MIQTYPERDLPRTHESKKILLPKKFRVHKDEERMSGQSSLDEFVCNVSVKSSTVAELRYTDTGI